MMTDIRLWRLFLASLVVLLVGLIVVAEAGEDDDDDDAELAAGLVFLESFGYMKKHDPAHKVTRPEIKQNLQKMQHFYHLPETGDLDATTVAMMKRPRCGLPDVALVESEVGGEEPTYVNANGYQMYINAKRKRRYTLSGSKWARNVVTYTFDNYTPDLPQSLVRREVQNGLKVWSDVTPLNFREVQHGAQEPDIHILFAAGSHNDEFEFDGQGGTLAHAFYPGPGLGGDAHFDDDETFTAYTPEGTNLFFVAAHELGHSLGLGHSDVQGSLMAPYYQGYQANFRLPEDDVLAIQELYGPNPNPVPPLTPNNGPVGGTRAPYYPGSPQSPGSPQDKSHCNIKFDAIADLRNELFLFAGSNMWRVNSEGRFVPGYPVRISSFFPRAPNNINAAFEKPGGITVLIKGQRYWEYNGLQLRPGFPKRLESMGLSDGVDAAFAWPADRMIYFVRGEEYWGMHDYRNRVDTNEYPRNLVEDLPGLPQLVDAAFSFKSSSYFVRGSQYWRYNHNTASLDRGFPRNFHSDWLSCSRLQMLQEASASKNSDKTTEQAIVEGAGSSGFIVTAHPTTTILLSMTISFFAKLFISFH